jgi:PadR family transcriptional regulator, regulatory protein PadR
MVGFRMTVGVLAVLGALLERPDTELYGLEIVRASGLEPGTIYPILQRLRGAGWVSDRWEDPEPGRTAGRPPRRHYRLSVEGRARALHAQQHGRDRSGLSRLLASPRSPDRGRPGMSGHRAFVSGVSEVLGGIGLRDQRATAGVCPAPAFGLSSLPWVRGLLPGEEGTGWWAEVTFCLAETPDPGQRQYVRSYRWSVPQLVWTSWTSQVRCVAPAPAGVEYSSVKWKGTKMSALSPEEKFGIKLHSEPGARTIDQMYSVLLGLVVLVLGIIGFIQTGFTNFTEMTDHWILGLFQTNGFHNLVYVIFGLLWMLGAFALTPAGNQGMNIAVGGSLLLVAVLGFLGYMSLLSIPAGINGDNLLHLAVALASVIVGGGLLSGRSR